MIKFAIWTLGNKNLPKTCNTPKNMYQAFCNVSLGTPLNLLLSKYTACLLFHSAAVVRSFARSLFFQAPSLIIFDTIHPLLTDYVGPRGVLDAVQNGFTRKQQAQATPHVAMQGDRLKNLNASRVFTARLFLKARRGSVSINNNPRRNAPSDSYVQAYKR